MQHGRHLPGLTREVYAHGRWSAARTSRTTEDLPVTRGLHSLTSEIQLEDLRDTSLTLELNLSTFTTHPQVNLGLMGDEASLS
jgi:hypothetical protein